jgi:NADH dehydrogenase FAD-containing subunit
MQDITMSIDALRQRGVRIVRDNVIAIDADKRQVRLAGGSTLQYERLAVAPGIDFLYDQIPGLKSPDAQQRILHAWKAGEQTLALRKQLESMPDGGVFVLHIPVAPFRCPPGPYERVCQVADYFKRAKPRSKILVLDSNPDLVSKKPLFIAAWEGLYKGLIEYRPNSELVDVDARSMVVKLQFDDVKGDVINVIPPQRAADIAQKTGLTAEGQRWCAVDWLTAESTLVKGIHVVGDATLSAAAMPKSASMANQHGKLCAAGMIALIKGEPVTPPVIMNTCYSFVSRSSAMHVASVHAYDAKEKSLVPVKGAGGLSDRASEIEGAYAWGWAKNIWADSLA